MSTTGTSSRAGTDLPGPDDLADAIGGFMAEFKTFTADIHTKFERQEERMNKLDRKSLMAGRPALAAAAEADAPHLKAFGAYLRSGDDDGLRGLELEGKALSTAVAAEGGYLVDPQTSDSIRAVLEGAASVRSIANVVTVDATSFDVLVDHADIGAGWASETGNVAETDSPQIDRITIPLHELSALPKASQRLLDDSAFDIEAWLAERIAGKFARSEAAAFVNGDGIEKPAGFLTAPQVDNSAWAWGSLGTISAGSTIDLPQADPIIDLVYALGAQYRARGTFVMNSRTAGAIRKLKDSDGRFLWSDGLAAAEPARLMGYPVLIAEDMPDIADGAAAIAFGDFQSGYTIAERPDLRVLRDPFSAKPHVLFYATKRVGGAVSDFAAIKLLTFTAA